MKKGYKATYGMKCESLTYEVGKTYQSSLLEMCKHGFHYCENIEDTEQYYDFNNETLKIIEIEILGVVVTEYDKSVSDKIKVLRVVPDAEYQHLLTQKEYDSNGNQTKTVCSGDDDVDLYEYDSNGNLTKTVYHDGTFSQYEYDSNGNLTKTVYHDGTFSQYEYDSNGNKTKEVYPNGSVYQYEYDSNGNKTKEVYPDGGVWELTIVKINP